MQIQHYIQVENNINHVYLNIITEDEYEFGITKDSGNIPKFLDKIRGYVKKNFVPTKDALVTLVINGVLIGTVTMSTLFANVPKVSTKNTLGSIGVGENMDVTAVLEVQTAVAVEETKAQTNTTHQSPVSGATNNKKPNTSKPVTTTPTSNVGVAKPSTNVNGNATKPATNTNTNINNTPATNNSSTKEEGLVDNNTYIKLNNKGNIIKIELEEYIIGVVAAEMPASFNIEALKAQAVAARTYTIKKASAGKILVNSTSDQVYNTVAEMKSKWGSEFTKYYNKIKNAVQATKGKVIKYNGKYIDALYCSMTNGKTEQAEYVWSYSYPYLKCVSSSWDQNVKGFEVTKNFEYSAVSSALGQTVTKDTLIEVLSYTVSGRVDKIKIGEKTYTGVQVRSKLGLRSTDFKIVLKESNISITTKGYGHGVGLSQYGANEMAKNGYTYNKILHHYYTNVQITTI